MSGICIIQKQHYLFKLILKLSVKYLLLYLWAEISEKLEISQPRSLSNDIT